METTEKVVEEQEVAVEETAETTETQEDAVFDVNDVKAEDIPNMSDEEVDRLTEDLEKVEPETSEETVEGAETQEEAGEETKTVETAEKPESEQASPEGTETTAEESTVETVVVPKEEWDKSQAHIKSQDEFDQRRNTEVGTLRSERQALMQENLRLRQATAGVFKPSEADQARIDEMSQSEAIAETNRLERIHESEQTNLQNQVLVEERSNNLYTIETHVPKWEDDKDGIASYIGEIFDNPAIGQDFVVDPASQPNGAMYLKMSHDVVTSRKESGEKDARIKDLEGKLKSQTDRIAAATSKPRKLGNIGSTAKDAPEDAEVSPDTDFSKMGEKELDTFLKTRS